MGSYLCLPPSSYVASYTALPPLPQLAAMADEAKKPVVVMTANSNTGSACIDSLLEKAADKFEIRAVVRRTATLSELDGMDVKAIKADIKQRHILQPVFDGVRVAYFATPATEDRVELVKLFVQACLDHGVQYAIIPSIVAADTRNTYYQKQFADIEDYVKSQAGKPVDIGAGNTGAVKFSPIILRCAPFYQNFYGSLGSIAEGTLYYPLAGEKMGHVDLNDVGECAAQIMMDPEPHANKIYNMVGEYQAGNQIASAIAMKAGVHCRYQEVDDTTTIAAFEALGLIPWIAKGNVEMLQWYREGNGLSITSDIPTILGRKPTKFGDFVAQYLKPMLQ